MSTEAVGPSPESAFDSAAATADDFVARLLASTTTGAELRVAVVTATENAGDYRVKTSATGPDFWCASLDASLRVDDRILLLKQESAYVAVGRLSGGGSTVPLGVINPYAGAAAPNGWLTCDGSAVSRTTYAGLFATIGTSYGGGDGSTTFNLPNLTNRVPLGSGSRGRGATGGAETSSFSGTSGAGGQGSVTVASGTGATVSGAGTHTHSIGGSVSTLSPFQVVTYIIKAR